MWANLLLCSLQVYFIIMSLTVERRYCHFPLVVDDHTFLMKEAYNFSVENNRLFLERPEWMRMATCIHCYTFPWYYATVMVATLWNAIGTIRFAAVCGCQGICNWFLSHYGIYVSCATRTFPSLFCGRGTLYRCNWDLVETVAVHGSTGTSQGLIICKEEVSIAEEVICEFTRIRSRILLILEPSALEEYCIPTAISLCH